MHYEYLCRLIKLMYDLDDCPKLDEYGTKIFGRPIKRSWKLFRYLARCAVAGDSWTFSSDECVYYSLKEVRTFEFFATFLLHEVGHGWCYFLNEQPNVFHYPTGVDEEQVCWDVSKLICQELGISYDQDEAALSHRFHLLVQAGDGEGLVKFTAQFPPGHRLSLG